MAKYINREELVEWLKRIPLKDLSDGRGLCRVIFEEDFKRSIKKIPKGIIVDVAPVRHGCWERVIPSKSAAKWSTKIDECKWMQDEVCVNADCPACADYCPVANTPGVCKYEERGNSDAQKDKRQTGAK